jgi:hypothetical protein
LLPTDPTVFERFLTRVAFDDSKTNCHGGSSLAWRHLTVGYVSPAKSPRTSAIIVEINKMLAAPASRKAPLASRSYIPLKRPMPLGLRSLT